MREAVKWHTSGAQHISSIATIISVNPRPAGVALDLSAQRYQERTEEGQ